MYAQCMHKETGQVYTIPVRQVVVYDSDGKPVAITLYHGGFIVHTDVLKPDFQSFCALLRVTPQRFQPSHDQSTPE